MGTLKTHFCIDLSVKNPEVMEYSPEVIREDLEYFGFKDPMELNDYDHKIFKTEKAAESWLTKYKGILKALDNNKICLTKDVPTILYKRRYIVQTLMGEKLQTYRDSDRVHKMMSKVTIGGMFNLNDQTFFLTVVLKAVEKIDKKTYKYVFDLPGKKSKKS
ncbi:hypothetical protein AZI85_17250 [Bdellovibrio bacteriovorus]|uniref:Uncharacterized protein n=1 Tax=Bdellovibrio bacteriovorus TaxID=959 RepID=A0A150WSZ4_BDEBC|nr:hypothetical protein [Bdellovibrio bacteriovorus]KYG67626.1 hypothetical protein AZI85_17250 [Bdellovibrio bacteriovorus]